MKKGAGGLSLGLMVDSIHSQTSDMALASGRPCRADVLPAVTGSLLSHELRVLDIFISLNLTELEIFPVLLLSAVESGTCRGPWCERQAKSGCV